jgi:NADH:ubiquinone oxidoreductase subunit
MAKIATLLSNWLYSKIVGQDQFGNRYYIAKNKDAAGKYARTVIYKGINEPSKVPALWHQWLHYMSDQIPDNKKKHAWEKEHQPNATGTKFAHHNVEHDEQGKKITTSVNNLYQPWIPKLEHDKK